MNTPTVGHTYSNTTSLIDTLIFDNHSTLVCRQRLVGHARGRLGKGLGKVDGQRGLFVMMHKDHECDIAHLFVGACTNNRRGHVMVVIVTGIKRYLDKCWSWLECDSPRSSQ